MNEYTWTVRSAANQVAHGGPTRRTLSAIEYLSSKINSDDDSQEIAGFLLDLLTETRGLANLSQNIILIQDDEIPNSLMTPIDNVLSAVNDFGAFVVHGPVTKLRFPNLTAAAMWADEADIAVEVSPSRILGVNMASGVEVTYEPKK